MTAAPDDGLLFVYAETGPNVTEAEFSDWYDNDHAPARLAVPGITSATRYKAVDGKTPSWLALYNTTSPDVIQSDAYKALFANASANEKALVPRIATLSRRVYSRFATVENPALGPNALPGPVLLVVGIRPTPENEDECNAWYKDEHLSLLSKVPGFVRARRYKLVSHGELAGPGAPEAFPYVTLYEWESGEYSSTQAFKDALATPLTVKVLGELANKEFRSFAVHKNFAK